MDSDPLYGDDPTADRDDAPSPSDDTALKPPGSDSPRRIGGYHVKSVIASGGMGTVYVVLQEQPRRTVALKVMKAGIASRSALRRFEYESQILARLRHPNIAQVYEAGTHDDGSGGVPYFAMEYVPGAMPLAEYAINKKLSTRERLDLFAKVCDAVHHGHQKGIIHRDLKPSNILVDSSGEPKIIDFGVARATDSDLAVTTLQTDIGQLIGTVQYMSPEQFAADPHDLDTRSDVYALGVVLFEMLCEQLPYDVTRVALHEAARVVREDEPAKPSTINRTLRGDVETITLKAMEKDRDRRYRSAEALAEDVRHYLRDEPIEARPPSLIDQARRFGRRHRAVAVSAAVIGLVLLASTGIIVQQLVLSRAAQHRAETINDFFMSVTRSASPFARRASSIVVPGEEDVDERLRTEYAFDAGTDPTVGHVFRFAAKQMDRYQWDPEVEISLRAAIGSTLRDTGHLTEATRHLRLAIEKQQAQRGVSVSDSIRLKRELALSLALAGRWKEALSEYRAAYDASRESLGAGNPLTIEVSEGVADALGGLERRDEAIEHLEQSVEAARRERGEDDKLVLLHSFRLALAVAFRDTDEALEIASKAFEAIEARASASSFARIEAHHLYGNLLQNAGWSVSAVPVLEESLRLSRAAYGEDHPATSRTAFTLCTALFELGRFEATLDICEGLLTLHETQRGPDSVPALMAMNCVAASLAALDRDISRAEELAEHARSCLARTHGAGSREVIYVRVTLATIRERQGQLQAARDMLEAIIQDLQSRPTFKDSLAIEVPRQLGHIMVHEGRFRDAEDLLLATHDEAVATFGEQSTIARSVAEEIAQLYDAWGNSGEAERWRTSPHTSGE